MGNLEIVKQAWGNIAQYHPQIRKIQNEIMGCNLQPAKIKFGYLQHFLRGDYIILGYGISDTVVVAGSYVKDFQKDKKAQKAKFSLDDYILHRVADAEGIRTANYVYLSSAFAGSLMNNEEPLSMQCVGNWLGYEALKRLNRPVLPLDKTVNATITDEKALQNLLKNPFWVFKISDEVAKAKGYGMG